MSAYANVDYTATNRAAFVTITGLAVGTGAAAFQAAVAVTTVATVAYATLAVLGAAISGAAIAAWADPKSTSASKYFENVANYSGYAIAGTFQLVSQVLVQAIVEGAARGIGNAIARKIGGPDVTFRQE